MDEPPIQVTQDLCRSNRSHHRLERHGLLLTQGGDVLLRDQNEPVTYLDAIVIPDSERWLGAIKSKMESM